VLARFAPWLRLKDPDYKDIRGEVGKPLYFVRNDAGEEVVVPKGTGMARGRSFIPATVQDNPFLATSEYIANMNAMSVIDRARIMHGDWLVKPSKGLIFKSSWFGTAADAPPTNTVARLRYWDLAGTEEARATVGTAWTAGILLSAEVISFGHDGTPIVCIWIEDIIRGQWHPLGVIEAVERALEQDKKYDSNCLAYVERDPGQAGKFQSWFISARAGSLGHHLRPVPPQGSKISRARTPSAHAEQGMVKLVAGKWNRVFLQELDGFPEGLKDQVDSFTGGFIQLMLLARSLGGKGSGSSATKARPEMDPQKNHRKGGF
jgi:predicted phage terminase large subunit-like protein